MNSWFKTEFVHEPQLIFGGKREERDPKTGLARYGPYRYEGESLPLGSIRTGIISNRTGIDLTLEVVNLLKNQIPSYHEQNQWLFPNYTGMNPETSFQCSIQTSKIWHAIISDDLEIEKITSEELADPNKRIAYGVSLFVEKMRLLSENDDPPDVVICTLPKTVELYCGISEKTRGAKTSKPTKAELDLQKMKDDGQTFLSQWGVTLENEEEEQPQKSFDFRNALKGKIMEFGIPIQILHESTCEQILNYASVKKHKKQDPCSFAWNLSTALFYKANGKPWRLAKLPEDTCYVGISFFRDKLHPTKDIQISMAQVFTHTGEGLVLRGTEVDVDHNKQAYLKKDQATSLLSNAISKYIEKSKRNPARIVIHKTSDFSEDEKLGFNDSISKIGNLYKDFVTIRSDHGEINFMRIGKFPIMRGTIINLDDEKFLLYTSGYTPRIRTYAGHSIPNPLKIKHKGDSTRKEIASEILGLTKLNWNTASFATYLPITIKFASEVGKILSELPEEKVTRDHYRFFM